MNDYYQTDINEHFENENENENKKAYSSLYFITHIILSFFAIYLSWRCSGSQFNIFHFIVAFCCPHLYIIWSLAMRGGCGIFGTNTD